MEVTILPKWRKIRINHKRSVLQKSQKLLAENCHERPPIQKISKAIHSISMAGYVPAVLAIVCAKLHAREASIFLIFFYDFLRYNWIFLHFDSSKPFCF